MIQSLKNPHPAFADVIKTHFKMKSRVIKEQLDRWLREDDGQPLKVDSHVGAVSQAFSGTGVDTMFQKNVEEMKRLLDELVSEPEA